MRMTKVIGDPKRFGWPMPAVTVTLGVLTLAAALGTQGCASKGRVAEGQPAGAGGAAARRGRCRPPDEGRAGTPQRHGAGSARGHVAECQDTEDSGRSRAPRARSSEERCRAE